MSAPPRADPAAGGISTRKLARQGSASLLGAGVTAVAGLLLVVVVTRGTSKTEAGTFFAATSLFLLVSTVAKLGTPTGVVWALSRYRALDRFGRVRPALRQAVVPVAVAGLVSGAVLAAFAPVWAPVLLRTRSAEADAVFTDVVRALALFVPVAAVYDAVTAATRGYGTMRATVLVERIGRPVLQFVAVAAAVLTSSAVWLAAAWAVPYLPALGIVIVLLARLIRATPRGEATDAGGVAGEFWRFTAPRSLASVAQMMQQRLDIVLVGALRGPVDAALYTAATRFLSVGQTAAQAIALPVQSALGELLAVGDRAGANRVYRTGTAWVVVVTWPLYLAMLSASQVVLRLFGEGYEAGYPVTVVLSLSMLVATACGMVDMVLTMAGRTSWNLWNRVLAIVVQVGLDLLLIPRYGILGASIGWGASIVVVNLVTLAQVRVSLRMDPFGRATLLAAAVATACYGGVPALGRAVLGDASGPVLGGLAVATVLYAGALWALRRPLQLHEMAVRRRRRRVSTG